MNKEISKKIEDLFTSSIYPVCPNKQKCDNGQKKISNKPKMPYIGRDYGNNSQIPNLLFISLDSGDENEKYHTIGEIRENVEKNPPRFKPGKDKVKHWYQTFDIATLFLDKFLDDTLKVGVSYVDTYISHTNSAKCTQSKKGRAQADDNLFDNCREFVVKEIPIFNADIIITQGNKAWDCLGGYKKIGENIDLLTNHNGKEIKLPIYILEINNKKTLHIPMYHPSFFKGYWGQKKAFKDNIDKIVDIINNINNYN